MTPEDNSNKLIDLINKTKSLYVTITSEKNMPTEKKIQSYNQGIEYIKQATDILNNISEEIDNIDIDALIQNGKQDTIRNIDQMIELVSKSNLSISQLNKLFINLLKMQGNIPKSANVITNTKDECIFDACEDRNDIQKN